MIHNQPDPPPDDLVDKVMDNPDINKELEKLRKKNEK